MENSFFFGSGKLVATRNDVANATPVEFGTMQECSIDISASVKELFGGSKFAKAVAAGTMKVTGKAKVANISGRMFSDLFFGDSAVRNTGMTIVVDKEVKTIALGTLTAAGGANYVDDLGVIYASSGKILTKVTTAPAVGQYSVTSAGVYTFNTTDNGKDVVLRYSKTDSSTGSTIVLNNDLLGAQPSFSVVLYGVFQGKPATFTLFKCVATKWSLATKLEDFTVPEFEFTAFVDAADRLGSISISSND